VGATQTCPSLEGHGLEFIRNAREGVWGCLRQMAKELVADTVGHHGPTLQETAAFKHNGFARSV
jgi:hypothetical protein